MTSIHLQVFVRELISNASDALEKFRYTINTAGENQSLYEDVARALEIHIGTDKQSMVLTIQDTGIGMDKDELINNLGTIARSGSKKFLEEIKEKGNVAENSSNIIGQFGVGFYSAFMVADKVEVFTKYIKMTIYCIFYFVLIKKIFFIPHRSAKSGSPGLRWSSDGSGAYEIQTADGVAIGTKIVIHLKTDCREFSDEERIQSKNIRIMSI